MLERGAPFLLPPALPWTPEERKFGRIVINHHDNLAPRPRGARLWGIGRQSGWLPILSAVLAVTGCRETTTPAPEPSQPPPGSVTSEPLGAREVAAVERRIFERIEAASAGIGFVAHWKPRDFYEANLLRTGFTGGGVCLGDYDRDGLCDLYLSRPHGGGRLYRNRGNFRFEDVTAAAGLEDTNMWTTGVAFADVDNDGWLDLFVGGYISANRLYLNQRQGTFTNRAAVTGLDFRGATVKMVFADYDRDGDLDGYLVTSRLEPREPQKIRFVGRPGNYGIDPAQKELAGVINLPDGEQKFVKAGQRDRLYRNELAQTGRLQFTEVALAAGIEGNDHGLDATWWDDNGDGFPDLYVSNDYTDPDYFYRNKGDGTFTNIIGRSLPHTPWFAMGSAAGDFNNDGLLDLMATDMAGTSHAREKIAMGSIQSVAWFLDFAEPRQYMRNALFLNTGTGRFLEIAYLAGVASSDWTWSVKAADLDNDGRLDIFNSNGFTRDYLDSDFNTQLVQQGLANNSLAWYDAPELRERNVAFRNLGGLRFTNLAPAWQLDEIGISFGTAFGDLDNDGDLDVVINNFDAPPSLYRNRVAAGHTAKIRLRGLASNRDGLGATLTLETPSGRQTRFLAPASGYMSADEPLVCFGLGDSDTIPRLSIRWPSGRTQLLENLPADHLLTITEPGPSAAPAPVNPVAAPEPPLFTRWEPFPAIRHQETPHDDFALQPLLPNKLSQLGPGMAWGDADGDGDDDLFVGGAAGQAGQLWLQNGQGAFAAAAIPALEEDRACEDLGSLFFDADADGDDDLFVVSGGVECPPGSPLLRDRLYLNQTPPGGRPRFVRAVDALPDLRDSGGVAAAADFDQDGDLDLFVGGRVVPGSYPTSPVSRLLRNDQGRFQDVAPVSAPGLAQAGMITGALWSDANDDGWVDLLLTTEYGPIRFFRNNQGVLLDQTAEAGTAKLLGWWNSIAGADVDHDGDIDYAVGNLGWNTKYRPSPSEPCVLLYGDLDGSGTPRIAEARTAGPHLLPVRGKDCLARAMPSLMAKFQTFRSFAKATIPDIYPEANLQHSLRLQANTAASGILINNGQGRFSFEPLHSLAQTSPIFGLLFLDADGDPHPDLYVAQNFFSPQRETGRMDGGLSLLLRGDGHGAFLPVWPGTSGLVVPGDAKAAAATDLDGDGWEDLVVAANDGLIQAFRRQAPPPPLHLTVHLQGRPGNLNAAGARLRLLSRDGPAQTREIHAGAGYLTQSPARIRFTADPANPPTALEIRWPRGQCIRRPVDLGTTRIEEREP